jgi:hypothetical protein
VVQRWLMGTVLMGLAVRMAVEDDGKGACGIEPPR